MVIKITNTKKFKNIIVKHLFISAPTTVAIRLGMEYQEGTMSEVSIYNYNGSLYNYFVSIDKKNVLS